MGTIWIVTEQLLFGAHCLNKYIYYSPTAEPDYADLIEAVGEFKASICPLININQIDAVQNLKVRATRVDTGGYSYEEPWSGTGSLDQTVDKQAPSWNAYRIRMFVGESYNYPADTPYVGDKPIRPGAKYLAGVSEDAINGGIFTPPAYLASSLNDYSEAMVNFELTLNGGADSYQQIVAGRRETSPGVFQELYAYVQAAYAVGVSPFRSRKVL